MFGSSEGPITFDLKTLTVDGQKEDKSKRSILQDQGVYHKAQYAGKNSRNIVYCEIGGNTVNWVENFGNQNSFELQINSSPQENSSAAKIIDFDVSKQTREVSVLYEDVDTKTTKLMVIEMDHQSSEGLSVREDFVIGQNGKRVSYTKDNSIFVLTMKDWNIYNTSNSNLVS